MSISNSASQTTLSDFSAATPDGTDKPLSDYTGDVVLVVNTASKCGFARQFDGLEELWNTHRDQGFAVLGFPSNQFRQEPVDDANIGDVCRLTFGVTFPMFAKIDVNGSGTHPLYRWLKDSKGGLLGGAIKWNFTKFLVGRDGRVIERFGPTATPKDIEGAIVSALAAPRPGESA